MEELFKLGLNDNDVKFILEQCLSIDNKDVLERIEWLRNIGCNDRHIRNIIVCNPYFLDRDMSDLNNLISYLGKIGVSNIYLLFDSNPFLLNKDFDDINGYVENKLSLGILLEDIVDEIESNPYVID